MDSSIVFIAPGIKQCEVCKKTLVGLLPDNTTGEKYIALVVTKGKGVIEAHFFCSIQCLNVFLNKKLEEMKKAQSMVI